MSPVSQRWDEGLSGTPRRIAETHDSPLRVLAGPGTGKTFALMRRVMRLLEDGSPPEGLFVCTFTRTAARDLETELRRLGVPGAEQVRTGTVHSFCFGLLSRAAVLPLTGRTPRPLLGFEERFLLQDLVGKNSEGLRALKKRLDALSAAWARLQSETPGWAASEADQRFHQAVEAWLRFHQAMLIGELVPEALRFLRDNPISPDFPRFEHLLADEYQDLNRAEQMLLDQVAGQGALTVVGDEDQSIYSFKHAHPEGIADFDQSHSGTHDESLDECRRCPQLVVAMANRLIENNPTRASRVLKARPGNPTGEVLVLQWPSLVAEADGLAGLITDRLAVGTVEAGRILVLAPRRQIGYAIRDALIGGGVPAHSFFYEESLDGNPMDLGDCQAQEAFALLTLVARPDDRVALRCWCGFGSPSLNAGAWKKVRQYSASTGISPRAVLEQLAAETLTLPRTEAVVARFRLLQTRLSGAAGLRGTDLIDAVFPSTAEWAAQIRASVAGAEPESEPSDLLETIQRAITQPELPTDVDYVRVMSLHKSKGLTADLVIVAGCIEGLIPTAADGAASDASQRALEEQRRLFYVAITRATQTLVLSSVTRLQRADAHKMGARVTGGNRFEALAVASRFLAEMGPDRPSAIDGRSLVSASGAGARAEER